MVGLEQQDYQCLYCGKLNNNDDNGIFLVIDYSVFNETTKNKQIKWLWDCKYCTKTNYTITDVSPEMIKDFQMTYIKLMKQRE